MDLTRNYQMDTTTNVTDHILTKCCDKRLSTLI